MGEGGAFLRAEAKAPLPTTPDFSCATYVTMPRMNGNDSPAAGVAPPPDQLGAIAGG